MVENCGNSVYLYFIAVCCVDGKEIAYIGEAISVKFMDGIIKKEGKTFAEFF